MFGKKKLLKTPKEWKKDYQQKKKIRKARRALGLDNQAVAGTL